MMITGQMGRHGRLFYSQTLIKIGIIAPQKRLAQNDAFQNGHPV